MQIRRRTALWWRLTLHEANQEKEVLPEFHTSIAVFRLSVPIKISIRTIISKIFYIYRMLYSMPSEYAFHPLIGMPNARIRSDVIKRANFIFVRRNRLRI